MKHKPIPKMNQTDQKRFWSKVKQGRNDECWQWRGANNGSGYGQFWLNGCMRMATRVAYRIHYHKDPGAFEVCHSCDTPGCVNPHHLWLGTITDNIHDCHAKGRNNQPRGEQCVRRKLSKQDVCDIRASNESHRILAQRHGVHVKHIGRIKRNESWRDS